MTFIKFFSKSEKEKFTGKLNEQFGINEIPFNLVRWGKERIIVIPEEISERQLNIIGSIANIENLGLYLAKEENDGIRLSIEGTHLLKEQIKKNIFELDEKQLENWMLGYELNVQPEKKGFVVMKYKNDFLGTGKASENRITNFVPKSRRLKSKGV